MMSSQFRVFAAKLTGLLSRRKADHEFDDEMRLHLQFLTERFTLLGEPLMRFRHLGALIAVFTFFGLTATSQTRTRFDLETATVADINKAIDNGALTSEQLVKLSLARLKAYEPELNAVITVNPHALDEARALDRERVVKGRRSALHGIPIVLKDNINTRDLPTTLVFWALRVPFHTQMQPSWLNSTKPELSSWRRLI